MNQPTYNGFPPQDSLAGQFDMWQPPSQNQSSASMGLYNTVTTSSGWQTNRDNAIDEAYRSMHNMSLNNPPIGNREVYSPSPYSNSNLNQSALPQYSMSQLNQYSGVGMQPTSSVTTQHYYDNQSFNHVSTPPLGTNPPLAAHNSPSLSSMQSNYNSWTAATATTAANTRFQSPPQRDFINSSPVYSSTYHEQPVATTQIYRNPLHDGSDEKDGPSDSPGISINATIPIVTSLFSYFNIVRLSVTAMLHFFF